MGEGLEDSVGVAKSEATIQLETKRAIRRKAGGARNIQAQWDGAEEEELAPAGKKQGAENRVTTKPRRATFAVVPEVEALCRGSTFPGSAAQLATGCYTVGETTGEEL